MCHKTDGLLFKYKSLQYFLSIVAFFFNRLSNCCKLCNKLCSTTDLCLKGPCEPLFGRVQLVCVFTRSTVHDGRSVVSFDCSKCSANSKSVTDFSKSRKCAFPREPLSWPTKLCVCSHSSHKTNSCKTNSFKHISQVLRERETSLYLICNLHFCQTLTA